jgi:hypothetical protein
MVYESTTRIGSRIVPGVEFVIRKMSFARRVEIIRQIRDLAQRVEFHDAGSSTGEKLDGALVTAEIDRRYIVWGLQEVAGLELDGAAATPETLVERGPEELVHEAVAAIKAECGLTEAERKN